MPLKEICYGYEEEASLASVVVEALKKESKPSQLQKVWTQGSFPSDFGKLFRVYQRSLKGGFVTYSLEEKAKMLDISQVELQEHGVVSAFAAGKMAEQARLKTQSDFGISLTGVAGPDSLEGHPAGTVFIGLSQSTRYPKSFKVNIAGKKSSGCS